MKPNVNGIRYVYHAGWRHTLQRSFKISENRQVRALNKRLSGHALAFSITPKACSSNFENTPRLLSMFLLVTS